MICRTGFSTISGISSKFIHPFTGSGVVVAVEVPDPAADMEAGVPTGERDGERVFGGSGGGMSSSDFKLFSLYCFRSVLGLLKPS